MFELHCKKDYSLCIHYCNNLTMLKVSYFGPHNLSRVKYRNKDKVLQLKYAYKKNRKRRKRENSICQFISSKLNGHFTTFLLWFTSTKFNDRKIWFYWTLLLNIIELKLFLKRDGACITSNLWQIWYNSAGAHGVPRSQVCAHLTPRFPPYQHQQNFFGAHVQGEEARWVYSSLIPSFAIVLCSWKPHGHVRLGSPEFFPHPNLILFVT